MAVKKPINKMVASYRPKQTANNLLTMVANVSGASANTEIQDASAQLTQAEFRVFAKTVVTEINAIRAALVAAGLMA